MRITSRRTRVCVAIVALAGLLAGGPVALAQDDEVVVQVVQVDDSGFPEIEVYVSITDADGQPVTDLTEGDFLLEENGEQLDLTGFSQAGEHGPVTAVLVIDKSGSMIEGKMEAAREAGITFVNLMRPGDVTGVIAFDTEVTEVQALTDDQAQLVEAIGAIEMGSDTAMYDALHVASEMLAPVSGRRTIIFLTDGKNTAGERTYEETMALIGEQGISIYTIGLGDPTVEDPTEFAGMDEEVLQAIADESNGIYQYAPGPEDLSELYGMLSMRLQNEYKLTYNSPNPLRDGSKRNVVVSVVADGGATDVAADYNPGGVIPEVAPGSTWGTFALFFVGLALLLAAPSGVNWVVGLVRSRGEGGGKRKEDTKASGSVRGRIRLTDDPAAEKKRRSRR